MTIHSLELKFVQCYKRGNYCLQFKMNKLSGEFKLIVILFKLAQFVKFELALIWENSIGVTLMFDIDGDVNVNAILT